MICEVEKNYLTSYLGSFFPFSRKESPFFFGNDYFITFTSSGKAALFLILEWLRSQKIIRDKTDALLVPRWLGNWVYKTIHQSAFLTDIPTERTRAILVYHQYGFPQNMDSIMEESSRRRLVIIEDCAHALHSYYHKQRLGTFGEFSIFSFSKFFPILMGGAIITKNKNAHAFFQAQLEKSRNRYRPFTVLSKYLATKHPNQQTTELLEMSYALYPYQTAPSHSALKIITKHFPALEKRRQNYQTVRSVLKNTGLISNLEEDALPFIIPLQTPVNQLNKIIPLIKNSGYLSDLYHFDVNRNLFNPKFVPIAWLPVHQGIKNENLTRLCQNIKNTLIS